MCGGDKTSISQLHVKHSEQTDHHSTLQQHLEKVEAIEVLDCTLATYTMLNMELGEWINLQWSILM